MVYQNMMLRTTSTDAPNGPKMPWKARQCWGLALVSLALLLNSCTSVLTKPQPLAEMAVYSAFSDAPPPALREFRAMWVATVANIDWPSRRDLSVAQQRTEMINIIERAKDLKLNAIILQVRTSADALYDSKLEPWSEYLTGEQGRAPNPYYDPLAEWIEKSHAAGLELHAWFNPYRARHTGAKSPPSPSHIANTIPDAVKSYGGYLWMDPGEPAAVKQTLDVILDVVRRYDIDGVHIDDYFYPYPVNAPAPLGAPAGSLGPEIDFPDDPAWQRYLLNGGNRTRADWRRENVNALIEKMYSGIKQTKRWVKFGVSPFGLGKPALRPEGIKGFSQYDKLYADVELWLQRGWMDYLVPQLYWKIDQPAQSFPVLLDYWLSQNTANRHVWSGLYTSRILDSANPNSGDSARSWEPTEIVNQIELARDRANKNPLTEGHVHFSAVALTQNRKSVSDQLKRQTYRAPALSPAMPWLADGVGPAKPVVIAQSLGPTAASIKVFADRSGSYTQIAYWLRYPAGWQFKSAPFWRSAGNESASYELILDSRVLPDMAVVSVIDRAGNESARATVAVSGTVVGASPAVSKASP